MQGFRKNASGITLMALVVTIIILLILAGISIGMLSGENSIIKQAGNAKTQTDIAQEKEILEQVTVIAMGKSKYGNVEKNYLDNELQKYSEIDSTEDVDDGIQVAFNSGRVYLVDADGNVTTYIPPISIATLESMYGQEITGYSTQNGVEGWQLFYADKQNKEVFIISTNVISSSDAFGNSGIPLKANGESSNYTLSDFEKAELIYAQNYNSLWLELATTTYNKTRATAYLCDYNNWNEKYKEGKAKYAVGGPTIEMFVASYRKEQINNLQITDVQERGYTQVISTAIRDTLGLYNVQDKHYWLASPSHGSSSGDIVRFMRNDGVINAKTYSDTSIGLRPIVCFPQSAIQLLDNGTLTIKND